MTDTKGRRPDRGREAIAVVRILTGIIFLFFGEYKIAGPQFAQTSFRVWVHGWLSQNEPVGFYGMFLEKFVLVHPVLCARIVGWGELAIGIALVLGLFVRLASVGGAMHMISLALATWYAPGHGVAMWRYLGANLDHIPLLFLFVIFFATRAGEMWGLDGLWSPNAPRWQDKPPHPSLRFVRRSVRRSGWGTRKIKEKQSPRPTEISGTQNARRMARRNDRRVSNSLLDDDTEEFLFAGAEEEAAAWFR